MQNFYITDNPPLASLGKRLVGQFLDGLVPLVFLIAMIFLGYLYPSGGGGFLVAAFAFYLLYILFADGLGEGQSLGKRAMDIRVVDSRTGMPCSYWQSFLRNIFYILGIFDWIFIFGEKRQRLGDRAADTIVIEA